MLAHVWRNYDKAVQVITKWRAGICVREVNRDVESLLERLAEKG